MKRVRRQKFGMLKGRQKRRLRNILRDIHQGYGPGCYARTPCEMRDARRLVEAGLIVAAVSKTAFWGKKNVKELALFISRQKALKEYTSDFLIRREDF